MASDYLAFANCVRPGAVNATSNLRSPVYGGTRRRGLAVGGFLDNAKTGIPLAKIVVCPPPDPNRIFFSFALYLLREIEDKGGVKAGNVYAAQVAAIKMWSKFFWMKIQKKKKWRQS